MDYEVVRFPRKWDHEIQKTRAKTSTLQKEGGKLKKTLAYELDLTKIHGKGDFPCPNCGAIISPIDETEDVYRILETKVKGQDLEELIIQCNKCGSKIRLFGFLMPSAFTCPECGVYIDQAEQDQVGGNFYVCGNCFTVVYTRA